MAFAEAASGLGSWCDLRPGDAAGGVLLLLVEGLARDFLEVRSEGVVNLGLR